MARTLPIPEELWDTVPPVVLPWISFRNDHRWAMAHGSLVIGIALMAPGLTRRGRIEVFPHDHRSWQDGDSPGVPEPERVREANPS